jgi:catechol 2,3-dioxygenase-like lactoylglutathione lyase family enzyme
MIDHFTVSVTDLAASRAFFEKVLAPLGYGPKMEFEQYVGFGDEKKPYLWLKKADVATMPQHIAFRAASRAAVDAFHKAALEAGARNDGAPGIREMYHPHYYGAFVVDPVNGHPIEAVCHFPPPAASPKKAAAKKKPAVKKAMKKKSRR